MTCATPRRRQMPAWPALAGLLTLACIDELPPVNPALDAAATTDAGEGGTGGGPDARRPDARADATPRPDATQPEGGLRPDGGSKDGGTDGDSPDARPRPGDTGPDAESLCEDERCDGFDNDCDGEIDENFPTLGAGCSVGMGACAADGVFQCDPGGMVVRCSAQPGEAREEFCSGRDDDCDGFVDNVAQAGGPCTVDRGVCLRQGRLTCVQDALVCVTFAGDGPRPSAERCDGADNDCDGVVDNPTELCAAGVGACRRAGPQTCDGVPEGGDPRCEAVPGEPSVEICNGVDDDCNGIVDDVPGLGAACVVGLGQCARQYGLACGAQDEALVCVGEPAPPRVETCNGIDDDCDGVVDEDPSDAGAPCAAGVGACARGGAQVCVDGALRCDAVPGAPDAEACDGVDNDCDGVVDGTSGARGPCGGWIQQRCRLWFGWVDNNRTPLANSPTWGACPAQNRDASGEVQCTWSGQDGRFYPLNLTGDVDFNDWVGFRFECDDGAPGDWIERHCEVAFGYADVVRGQVEALVPQACALDAPVGGGQPRCVRTGGDGLFHRLQFQGNVNSDDTFGVTLFCADPSDPARAAAVQETVEVFFGHRDRQYCAVAGPLNPSASWDNCPANLADRSGSTRCAGAPGGAGFNTFSPTGNVNGCDGFSVALRRRPDNR